MCYLIYKGWRWGLVREVATLVGVLAGIWAAVHLSQEVAGWIGLESENAVLIAFFVCFVGALVLARNDVADADVYNFVSSIFDNLEEVTAAHAKGAELSVEFASSVEGIPYHPGAAQYFAEQG